MLCASKNFIFLNSIQTDMANYQQFLARRPKSLLLRRRVVCSRQLYCRVGPTDHNASGNIFEKRLIESYVLENGKDPITGEDLTLEDLVELKSPRIVRPRPPTLTSIPSLLSVFQNEWDALALETYKLQQNLRQTRQELSTALYQHDAAVRVIARLSRERDEARDALSHITVNGNTAINGEAMQIDGQEISREFVARVEATQERLAITAAIRLIN